MPMKLSSLHPQHRRVSTYYKQNNLPLLLQKSEQSRKENPGIPANLKPYEHLSSEQDEQCDKRIQELLLQLQPKQQQKSTGINADLIFNNYTFKDIDYQKIDATNNSKYHHRSNSNQDLIPVSQIKKGSVSRFSSMKKRRDLINKWMEKLSKNKALSSVGESLEINNEVNRQYNDQMFPVSTYRLTPALYFKQNNLKQKAYQTHTRVVSRSQQTRDNMEQIQQSPPTAEKQYLPLTINSVEINQTAVDSSRTRKVIYQTQKAEINSGEEEMSQKFESNPPLTIVVSKPEQPTPDSQLQQSPLQLLQHQRRKSERINSSNAAVANNRSFRNLKQKPSQTIYHQQQQQQQQQNSGSKQEEMLRITFFKDNQVKITAWEDDLNDFL